jgi:hypothetical protein
MYVCTYEGRNVEKVKYNKIYIFRNAVSDIYWNDVRKNSVYLPLFLTFPLRISKPHHI